MAFTNFNSYSPFHIFITVSIRRNRPEQREDSNCMPQEWHLIRVKTVCHSTITFLDTALESIMDLFRFRTHMVRSRARETEESKSVQHIFAPKTEIAEPIFGNFRNGRLFPFGIIFQFQNTGC